MFSSLGERTRERINVARWIRGVDGGHQSRRVNVWPESGGLTIVLEDNPSPEGRGDGENPLASTPSLSLPCLRGEELLEAAAGSLTKARAKKATHAHTHTHTLATYTHVRAAANSKVSARSRDAPRALSARLRRARARLRFHAGPPGTARSVRGKRGLARNYSRKFRPCTPTYVASLSPAGEDSVFMKRLLSLSRFRSPFWLSVCFRREERKEETANPRG